jgi:hypothetical protein
MPSKHKTLSSKPSNGRVKGEVVAVLPSKAIWRKSKRGKGRLFSTEDPCPMQDAEQGVMSLDKC